ncbi:hypothetical protein DL98DRAFT_519855 [Cadophora sp. DSE1049]|nr:hypothetical protein DL98DRAFT_519855 [Cadophora sp. DSE1049]
MGDLKWQELLDRYSAMSIQNFLERQQRSFEETLAGLVPPFESETGSNESRLACKGGHGINTMDALSRPKQQKSIEQARATVKLPPFRSEPGSNESHTGYKQSHEVDNADSLPEPKQSSGHQDPSGDVLQPQSKHAQTPFDSDFSEYPLNSTAQPTPASEKIEGPWPDLAEAELQRRSGRNQAAPLPSNSNHAANTTRARRPKRRDCVVYNFTGM